VVDGAEDGNIKEICRCRSVVEASSVKGIPGTASLGLRLARDILFRSLIWMA
jgi:hypothetical protein